MPSVLDQRLVKDKGVGQRRACELRPEGGPLPERANGRHSADIPTKLIIDPLVMIQWMGEMKAEMFSEGGGTRSRNGVDPRKKNAGERRSTSSSKKGSEKASPSRSPSRLGPLGLTLVLPPSSPSRILAFAPVHAHAHLLSQRQREDDHEATLF